MKTHFKKAIQNIQSIGMTPEEKLAMRKDILGLSALQHSQEAQAGKMITDSGDKKPSQKKKK